MKKDLYLEALMEGRESLADEMFAWMVNHSDTMMWLGACLTITRILSPKATQAAMQAVGRGD